MTELIAHRGPDDHGYHLRTHVGLGHRRLSIIDLAGGRQPLANEDDTVWIVFNGEIYNHVELRRELVARGHKFRTHSDTEAIVHAYEEWGTDCAKKLRGMFAFAIWDDRVKKLVLVRDRMGIKPVYYAQIGKDGGDLVFGSEIKSLLSVPQVDGAVDDNALSAYLALRYVPAPLTMFRGIKKLPPATVMTWQRGKITMSRYWDLSEVETRDATPPTEAEAANELQQRVDHVTKIRLMAEVPVGAFLSGGLDSTLITASMLRAADARGALKTFSVGYAEDATQSEDELAYARMAAAALGTEHHELRVTMKQAADALPKIIWHLDEPVADAACVPLYFLSQEAKKHVTVVLSGEGADEAMGGYSIYRKMQRMEQLRQRLGAGSSALSLLGRLGAKLPSEKLRRAARLCSGTLESSYRGVSRAFDDDMVDQLRNGPHTSASDVLHDLLAPHWKATEGMTPLRRMLYLDGKVWLPDDLLVKADKMTMAHAIELRVPFLDHELMEHTWALPDHMKISGGVGKALLRKAARGRVPQAVLDRPKMGFGTPTAAWLRGGMREMAEAALFDQRSLAHDRFDSTFVHKLWDRHQAGADLSAELWPLVVLELWHRNFNAEARPRPEPLSEVA